MPGPVGLRVERELHKSLLVAWKPPSVPTPWPIKGYQLFVNGILRATVAEGEDTRALVEGLQPDKVRVIQSAEVSNMILFCVLDTILMLLLM